MKKIMPPRARKNKAQERRGTPSTADGGQPKGQKGGSVFHFVTVNPTSEDQKTENRSLIRSHASKYIWRQHRATRADADAVVADGQYTNRPGPVTALPRSSTIPEAQPYPSPYSRINDERPLTINNSFTEPIVPATRKKKTTKSVFTDPDPDSDPDPGTNTNTNTNTNTDTDADADVSTVPSNSTSALVCAPYRSRDLSHNSINRPFNQLVTWLEDPCHIYPSILEESAISKLMRYAAFDLWPGLVLGASGRKWSHGSAAENWLPRAMSNPALFTAFLYGAAGHMQTRKRLESAQVVPQTRDEKLEQIVCETETIKQLNKMMKDPSQGCTDEVILAVLCMAFNRTDYSKWSAADSAPKAPLRNLQWLDVYGGLSLNDHHVKGLLALIETRGGLSNLTLPGLAETLSTSAIMLSTKYLGKPRLPFAPIYEESINGQTPRWPSLENPMEFDASPEGDSISKARLPDEMVEVLRNMKDYNNIINLYSQGLLPSLELPVIADRRNWIQYSLLSIPPFYEYVEQHPEAHRTYESCRLAAMIYSMLVIFPLPAANRPFRRLTDMIKCALVDSGSLVGWQHTLDMYLWVLALGGIASAHTLERKWFVSRFSEAIELRNLSTWEELRDILSSIMWMDSVCDYGGKALWTEATRY